MQKPFLNICKPVVNVLKEVFKMTQIKCHTMYEIEQMSIDDKRKILKDEAGVTKAEIEKKAKEEQAKVDKAIARKQHKAYKKPAEKEKKKKEKLLTLNSQSRGLTLKIYAEQLMPLDSRVFFAEHCYRDYSIYLQSEQGKEDQEKAKQIENQMENGEISYKKGMKLLAKYDKYWQVMSDETRAIAETWAEMFAKNVLKIDTTKWKIACIWHDRDTVASQDDMFALSSKKPHLHILIYRANGRKFRVHQVVDMLHIYYDAVADRRLIEKQGIASCRDRSAFYMYLMHATDQAIQDGKEPYDEDEIITNMTADDQDALKAGYKRATPKSKLSTGDWNKLGEEAYELGQRLADFDEWADNHFTIVQQSQAPFRVVHQHFLKGQAEGIAKKPNLVRCCILIHGKGNIGKSYTTREVLHKLNLKTCKAVSGSGKYDTLTARDDALFFDDVAISQIKVVADNTPALLHRRNRGDRPWTGKWVIATTNCTPKVWFEKMCGIRENSDGELSDSDQASLDAVKSRFFVCSIDAKTGALNIDKSQCRGIRGTKDWAEHDAMINKFADAFDEISMPYYAQKEIEEPDPNADYSDNKYHDVARHVASKNTEKYHDFQIPNNLISMREDLRTLGFTCDFSEYLDGNKTIYRSRQRYNEDLRSHMKHSGNTLDIDEWKKTHILQNNGSQSN